MFFNTVGSDVGTKDYKYEGQLKYFIDSLSYFIFKILKFPIKIFVVLKKILEPILSGLIVIGSYTENGGNPIIVIIFLFLFILDMFVLNNYQHSKNQVGKISSYFAKRKKEFLKIRIIQIFKDLEIKNIIVILL